MRRGMPSGRAGRRLKSRLEGLTAAKSAVADWRESRRSGRSSLSRSIMAGARRRGWSLEIPYASGPGRNEDAHVCSVPVALSLGRLNACLEPGRDLQLAGLGDVAVFAHM